MVFPRAPPSGKPSSLGETFHHVTPTGMAYLYNVTSSRVHHRPLALGHLLINLPIGFSLHLSHLVEALNLGEADKSVYQITATNYFFLDC